MNPKTAVVTLSFFLVLCVGCKRTIRPSGIVTDTNGTPLPAAKVTVTLAQKIEDVYTDETGSFHFKFLGVVRNEQLKLKVALLGYRTDERTLPAERSGDLRITLQQTPPIEVPWALRMNGLGPVEIGMSIGQLNSALKENFEVPEARDEQGCYVVTSSHYPQLSFMLEENRLTRIEVDGPGVRTDKGITIGDSERRALEAYGGNLQIEQHTYSENQGDHYLTVRKNDFGVRFETENFKIHSFYAGRFESVQYVEGCL